MRKLPYQSSLQVIQRPQLLWNDIGDRKLWRGIQWIRRGPTVPSRLSWNAYQSNIPKPRSGVRWKHGMRRFSEYGNVASRNMFMDPFILVPFCWHQHRWNLWMWIPPHPYGLWDCKNRHPVDSPNSAYADNNFWESHRYISRIHQKKTKYIKLKHINPKTRNSLKIRFDAKSQPLFQCEVPTRSAQWPNTRGWPQRRPRSPDSAVERWKWH